MRPLCLYLRLLLIGCLTLSVHGLKASAFEKAALLIKEALATNRENKQKEVESFYKQYHFQPVWFGPQGWKPRRYVAEGVLQNAHTEGLDPSSYAYGWATNPSNNPFAIAQADIRLTQAILNYMCDIKGYRFNPRKLHKDINFSVPPFDAAHALLEGLQKDETARFLARFTLHHPAYQQLKNLLQTLHGKEKTPRFQPIPSLGEGRILKKGMEDERLPLIRARLGLAPKGGFDQALEDALKDFQASQGLEADGWLGNRSIHMMNKTPHDYYQQVLATMEKWRWVPENLPSRYILVNIPFFTLHAYDQGDQVLEMKVIIGKVLRRTPIFSASIDQVRFNPSWYVPRTIAMDKLSLIQQDPSYLAQKGFKVYDENGQQIETTSVNWSSLSSNHFPYRLVQQPGELNGLGKIRFNITSAFDIYLHGTSEPHLFNKRVRSLSSGCIRVEKPDLLGTYVLNNPLSWSLKTVQKAMEGTQTRNIKLAEPVPVFICYFTVWFNAQGNPVFADDIYEHDRWLIQAMNQKNHRTVRDSSKR